MSPELLQATFSPPRTRPRAATERAQPAKTAFLSPHSSTDAAPMAGTQADAREQMRARATSGPMRQPKPLAPSDIHLILEQEQEAMVNRMSREMTALRQRTSSVASTASSTSITVTEPVDAIHRSPYIPGPIYPTASRRHRSSSSLSGSYFPVIQGSRTPGPSRRQSFASSHRSQSLVPPTSHPQERNRDLSAHVTPSSHLQSRRRSLSQQRTPSSDENSPADVTSLMNENETLRRRIRDLELELSFQKNKSPSSKPRS